MTKLSFVIPCYRSENTIEKVVAEIIETVTQRADYDYEIICVNDASPDGVWGVLLGLAHNNPKIKLINLVSNRGKHAAILAGHSKATGDYVVDMDDDYQSPVCNLWQLLEPVEADECDVATANYYEKKESAFKRFGSIVNKYMVAIMLEKPVSLHLDNLSVMKRYISDAMLSYTNPYPYFEGLIFSITRRVKVVMMEQRDRADDNSTGYTFRKSLALWTNGLTAFSVKPLRVASVLGIILALGGFIGGLSILYRKFISHTIQVMGYASITCILFFFFGMTMMILGMLGEYIGRMYISMNNLPQYAIKEMVNVDKE